MQEQNTRKIVLWDWSGTIFDESNKPISKIINLIDVLYKEGCIQGIITNGHANEIKLLLRQYSLEKYFTYSRQLLLISPSMGYKPKPHTHMLESIIGWIELANYEILYIGDSHTDEIMANKGNVNFKYVQELT
jgi:phosphoglycolate phosphatase-like HAD superfamily hydrolase